MKRCGQGHGLSYHRNRSVDAAERLGAAKNREAIVQGAKASRF